MDASNNVGGENYNSFSGFYNETRNNDKPGFDSMGDNDLPRFQNNHIESFTYYTVDKFNNEFKADNSNLSTISINIRGIDCNYDNLILYLTTLNYEFDIIALTECQLQLNEVYNYDIENTHTMEGAVYPANCRSPRTRANSGELERTRANSARIRHQFANTDTPPNSGERSPEYAERSPEFGGVRPGSPEFARTPPRTGERFARKFVRGKKFHPLLTSVRRELVRRELGSRRT